MDPLTNPFTPGAGSPPPALTGRDQQLDQFELLIARLSLGLSERSMLIQGLRGVGKTVLLNTFEQIARQKDWHTAQMEVRRDTNLRAEVAKFSRRILLDLSRTERIRDRATRALRVLKAFSLKTPEGYELSIDLEPLIGTADSGLFEDDLIELFIELGQTAKAGDTGVVFLFDEIQFLAGDELEALIAALHRINQLELPVAIVGCGLPTIPKLAGQAKSYAERLFLFPSIGQLTTDASVDAIRIPAQLQGVTVDDEAAEMINNFTDGYPYFLQEYGKHTWLIADGDRITGDDVIAAHPRVQSDLDENFFDVRFQRATPREKLYISAMASIGDGFVPSGAVNEVMGLERPGQASDIRANLIDKGLIFAPHYGYVEFTVPHFASYVRRTAPST